MRVLKKIKCLFGFHPWEKFYNKDSGDPMRGCPSCNRIQTMAISFGLYFWHDLAKGWSYTKWKAFKKAKTINEKRRALLNE